MPQNPQPPNHEPDDDDQPVGRLLTRREALSFLGGLGAVMVVGGGLTRLDLSQLTPTLLQTDATATPLPSCVVRPALTEGPYFVDAMLNRSDIRVEPSDDSIKEGTLLKLKINVSDVSAGTCLPVEGAQVDIWHCDALGVYSGVSDPGFDTSDQLWLRGYQLTDEFGGVEFTTIYPGWYSGRAVHIHFKIRTDPESDTGYEFTSQFFFDEELTDVVHSKQPYASKGTRDTYNDTDNIYQSSDGLLTLTLEPLEDEEGYTATFDIGLDLSQPSPEEQGMGDGQPGGRPPGGRP
ncbi:MAG: intradiol ring-cleavage dioxygenase [Anaerolineae bacterium]|nr:intradiol ring-cleavage dioxygenase [Anaerolineae bacterium]